MAMLLPIALSASIVLRERTFRLLAAGLAVAMVLVLVRASSAGAWLGAVAGLAVVGAGLLLTSSKLGHKIRLSLALGVVLMPVVVFVAGWIYGGTSAGAERGEYWHVAVEMTADHPVAGVGPDLYRNYFPEYQSQKFVARLGSLQIVEGPHNTFLSAFSGRGLPGGLLYLTVLGLTGLYLFRALVAGAHQHPESTDETHSEGRWALLAASAAAIAYLVQGQFNVQQPALDGLAWLLLGLIVALCRPQVAHEDGRAAVSGDRTLFRIASLAVGAVALTVTLVGFGRLYAADRAYAEAQALEASLGEGPADPNAVAQVAERYQQAADLNPWEPSYPGNRGRFFAERAVRANTAGDSLAAAAYLARADEAYDEALDRQPRTPLYIEGEAITLINRAKLEPERAARFERRARQLLRRGLQISPLHDAFAARLESLR
jgi:hypothetical protein